MGTAPDESTLTEEEHRQYQLIKNLGPTRAGQKLGVSTRWIFTIRRKLEAKLGAAIDSPTGPGGVLRNLENFPNRSFKNIKDGIVLIGSDAHIWPGKPSTAVRAFIKLIKELGPKLVVLNGDVMDCTTISKHPPIGW